MKISSNNCYTLKHLLLTHVCNMLFVSQFASQSPGARCTQKFGKCAVPAKWYVSPWHRNWQKTQLQCCFGLDGKHRSKFRYQPNLVSGFGTKWLKLNSYWLRYLHFVVHPSHRSREGTREPCPSSVTIKSLTPAPMLQYKSTRHLSLSNFVHNRQTKVHNSLPVYLSNDVYNEILLRAHSDD